MSYQHPRYFTDPPEPLTRGQRTVAGAVIGASVGGMFFQTEGALYGLALGALFGFVLPNPGVADE